MIYVGLCLRPAPAGLRAGVAAAITPVAMALACVS
jgi:hypothetical protein